MAKKQQSRVQQSRSKPQQQRRKQKRQKSALETKPISWQWVPLASALAVGLPAIGLAVWNRAQISQLKETTQPVPDSEKNIKELYDKLEAVKIDQNLQKALIADNKKRVEDLKESLTNLPHLDQLQKVGASVNEFLTKSAEVKNQLDESVQRIELAQTMMEERLTSPWYSIAAPLGTAMLAGAATFVVTWPILSMVVFTSKPTDATLKAKKFRNQVTASGVLSALTAGLTWVAVGGPRGLGFGE